MNEENLDLARRTVTCHTEGCVNEGLPITFICAPTVVCGGCGAIIESVVTT